MSYNAALIQDISAHLTATIKAVVERLTHTEHKIVLIVDDNGYLCGTVTDYDIRQAILKDISFDSPITEIMSKHPIVMSNSLSSEQMDDLIRISGVDYIPIVDAQRRIAGIKFLRDLVRAEKPLDMIAVVMAGGFGRRLMPLTEHTPKPMVTVGNRPLLFIILDQLIAEGFTKAYVAVHYKSEVIIQAVEQIPRYRDLITFILEDKPLGTAGALGLLSELPRQPFLIINADILTQVPLAQMMQYHGRAGNMMTLATKVERHQIPFGVIDTDGARVVTVREKPRLEYRVSIGAYVANPDVLGLIPKGERLDMPDLVLRLIEQEKPVGVFPVHEYWVDVGTPEQRDRAEQDVMSGSEFLLDEH